ncbi:hypothetical protein FACS18949_03710 [Clostridia bacterium]|nr:hypothetical protein FACS18949_03710 [Clostridia bacterium]
MGSSPKLVNYMEIIIEKSARELLKQQKLCDCEHCRMDVMALALNNVKPHYVVSDKGQLFAKLDSFETQAAVDVTTEVITAIEKVKAHPRHSKTAS